MTADDLVARPGDPDLDCHLTGLRLTAVRAHGGSEFTAEATLTFSTMDAAGFSTRFSPRGQDFHSSFGLVCDPGDAAAVLGALRGWQRRGAFIEMTCAPGKMTLLQSKDACVILPGSEKAAVR